MKAKSILIIIISMMTAGIFAGIYNYTENNPFFNISTDTNQVVVNFQQQDLQLSLKLRTPPKRGLPNRREVGGTRFG
ncbi:hypothetical protein [Calothrix sp. UHCC 0171]|uniref:hypothetical protein n=1 Tax=Calothrix sp. UHCC 0171 TaxID=3110245 RepID=UPI002B1E9523|nr:hypothetical protein [Calothrix sp. UHCC 0171]MEA5572633.1 hypothetical protein [Calothrix sp. UHCC 0171]